MITIEVFLWILEAFQLLIVNEQSLLFLNLFFIRLVQILLLNFIRFI